MTTTKTKARVRAVNLYTVEQDGQPVAQAEAISQAEAIALWVASQQQPVLSARLATPSEARKLAHLPLLSRGGAAEPVDTAAGDLFASPEEIAEMRATALEVDLRGARELLEENGMTVAKAEVPAAPLSPEALAAAPVVDAEWQPSGDPASVLPAEFAAYIDGQESVPIEAAANDLLGALAEVLRVSPQIELDAAKPAKDGAWLSPEAQELYEAEGAARFADHHRAPAAAERRALGGKVAAMYRDPATGQTWSGRGLRPRWLVAECEAGRAVEEFLIDGLERTT